MRQFGNGIWLDFGPVRFLGMRLMATMVVLKLGEVARKESGKNLGECSLLVYSPIQLTEERRRAIDELGRVQHLYVPNLFHHLQVGEWAAAYPEAKLHAPTDLASKRPDLTIHRRHGEKSERSPEPEFEGYLDEMPIKGCRLQETVLLYHPAQTLIVADIVHNIGRPEHLWTSIYTKAMGFYDRVALSRMLRWTAFSNRPAARQSIDFVLDHPFERMVMGHGEALESGARERLREAYSWLQPVPT